MYTVTTGHVVKFQQDGVARNSLLGHPFQSPFLPSSPFRFPPVLFPRFPSLRSRPFYAPCEPERVVDGLVVEIVTGGFFSAECALQAEAAALM